MPREFHVIDVLSITTGYLVSNRHMNVIDVLSITTGYLVSNRHMNGVHDLLDYMTGDKLFSHQLPRAVHECAPALLNQHPQLAAAACEGVTPENLESRTATWVSQFGEKLPVIPLAEDQIDPVRIFYVGD